MMPVVRISDATFADLKTLAMWLEAKTPSQTIDKIVSEMMENLDLERDIVGGVQDDSGQGSALRFPDGPSLSFTRILKASVDGKNIKNPKWNGIIFEVLASMKNGGMSPEELVDALNIPARQGRIEENGFKFYSSLGISVQGQSAQDAWKEIQRISPKWKIPVEVSFEWRDNPKALSPGQKGVLSS